MPLQELPPLIPLHCHDISSVCSLWSTLNQCRRVGLVCLSGCLAFFLVAAMVGLWLRLQRIYPLGIEWSGHLIHTHSHLAFLGWVFNAFFALEWLFCVPPQEKRFGILFIRVHWVPSPVVVGRSAAKEMTVVIPLQDFEGNQP